MANEGVVTELNLCCKWFNSSLCIEIHDLTRETKWEFTQKYNRLAQTRVVPFGVMQTESLRIDIKTYLCPSPPPLLLLLPLLLLILLRTNAITECNYRRWCNILYLYMFACVCVQSRVWDHKAYVWVVHIWMKSLTASVTTQSLAHYTHKHNTR